MNCQRTDGFVAFRSIHHPHQTFWLSIPLLAAFWGLMLWDLLAALPLSPEWLAVRTEIASVFQNPNGHWQILGTLALNAGLWAGLPVFLNWRWTGQRPSVSDWALLGFLGLTVAHYAGRYSTAAGSTEALIILAGIWVAGIWRVVGSLHPLRRFWPVLWVGNVGLAVASLWNWPLFHVYHDREARRATGLWNNPNTYGLLAACLTAACLAWWFRLARGKQATVGHRPNERNIDRRAWFLLLPLIPATLGMVRSYSRGAWLGFLVAMVWCGWVRFAPPLRSLRARARVGSVSDRRRWLAVCWILFVLLVGGFSSLWFLKDFQNPLIRRVGNVVNHTDRSWRNRVDAWVGAARMTVARPVTGWGLNQVEATYAREFKPAHLRETAWVAKPPGHQVCGPRAIFCVGRSHGHPWPGAFHLGPRRATTLPNPPRRPWRFRLGLGGGALRLPAPQHAPGGPQSPQ